MMIPLKYATADQVIPLGPTLDPGDGDTEITSGTISNTDIKIWKNGATSLVDKNSGGATYMSNAEWYMTLDEIDTDTYGPMKITVHEAGTLVLVVWCVVMNVNAYNKLYSGTGFNDLSSSQLEARTPSAAQLLYMTRHSALALPVTFSGTGTTTTATLATVDGTTPSSVDDMYVGAVFIFNSGTLANRRTRCTGYNGTTKVATFLEVPFAITSSHTAVLI